MQRCCTPAAVPRRPSWSRHCNQLAVAQRTRWRSAATGPPPIWRCARRRRPKAAGQAGRPLIPGTGGCPGTRPVPSWRAISRQRRTRNSTPCWPCPVSWRRSWRWPRRSPNSAAPWTPPRRYYTTCRRTDHGYVTAFELARRAPLPATGPRRSPHSTKNPRRRRRISCAGCHRHRDLVGRAWRRGSRRTDWRRAGTGPWR